VTVTVGYCPTCRFFHRWASEREINHPLRRFGKCRLGVVPLTVNAMCDRWQAAKPATRQASMARK
jgi:hypothetical protein